MIKSFKINFSFLLVIQIQSYYRSFIFLQLPLIVDQGAIDHDFTPFLTICFTFPYFSLRILFNISLFPILLLITTFWIITYSGWSYTKTIPKKRSQLIDKTKKTTRNQLIQQIEKISPTIIPSEMGKDKKKLIERKKATYNFSLYSSSLT